MTITYDTGGYKLDFTPNDERSSLLALSDLDASDVVIAVKPIEAIGVDEGDILLVFETGALVLTTSQKAPRVDTTPAFRRLRRGETVTIRPQ